MSAKPLSQYTTAELIDQFTYPVAHHSSDGFKFVGDPFGDDANEFGEVVDYDGHVLVTAQNGVCKLVEVALNSLKAAQPASQEQVQGRKKKKSK